MTTVYWIEREGPGRLGLMPRPRGGEWLADEIADLKSQGVHIVASALTDWEIEDLDLSRQAHLCDRSGVEFWHFPIPDRSTPSLAEAHEFLLRVQTALDRNRNVVIHCRFGVGRSGILAAGVLMLQKTPVSDAVEAVARARGQSIPDTQDQRRWLDLLHAWIKTESE